MDKGNYTLKDMLKAGMSVEEIQADFNKQIEAAQAELAKDENNSKKMQARAKLIEGALEYIEAMDYLDEALTEEDKAELTQALYKYLAKFEENFKMYEAFIKKVLNKEKCSTTQKYSLADQPKRKKRSPYTTFDIWF